MLNHSCAPNIRNEFEANKLTIFATEDIAEGGEVFNCYGPNYKLMSYQERQDSLRLQYNFVCDCVKCQEKNDEYVNKNFCVYFKDFETNFILALQQLGLVPLLQPATLLPR